MFSCMGYIFLSICELACIGFVERRIKRHKERDDKAKADSEKKKTDSSKQPKYTARAVVEGIDMKKKVKHIFNAYLIPHQTEHLLHLYTDTSLLSGAIPSSTRSQYPAIRSSICTGPWPQWRALEWLPQVNICVRWLQRENKSQTIILLLHIVGGWTWTEGCFESMVWRWYWSIVSETIPNELYCC